MPWCLSVGHQTLSEVGTSSMFAANFLFKIQFTHSTKFYMWSYAHTGWTFIQQNLLILTEALLWLCLLNRPFTRSSQMVQNITHTGTVRLKLRGGAKIGQGWPVRVVLFWKFQCANCVPASVIWYVPCDRIVQRPIQLYVEMRSKHRVSPHPQRIEFACQKMPSILFLSLP